MFEREMMDLSVNIPLEQALDRGWTILAACFDPAETGLRTELINRHWPTSVPRRKAGERIVAQGQAHQRTSSSVRRIAQAVPALPANLQLKKQQLQIVIRQVDAQMHEKGEQEKNCAVT